MLCCLDVAYGEDIAVTAAVLFQDWTDEKPFLTQTDTQMKVAPYRSGQFFERELPCLLSLLKKLDLSPSLIVVDGHAWLGREKPGLGAHLHAALDGKTPVIGVAKNSFHNNDLCEAITRGESQKPLWLSVCGSISLEEAKAGLKTMHGNYRVPSLLKLVDRLCRDELERILSQETA